MIRVYKDPWFDRVIMALIFISTITLAFESPLNDPEGQVTRILNYIDYVMSAIFLIECFIKIIAVGFLFNGKSSYLRSPWNVLDFIIVCASVLSIIFVNLNLSFIKSLRILRILRPLRLISRN